MEPEYYKLIAGGMGFATMGVGAYCLCKYIFKPLIEGLLGSKERSIALKEVAIEGLRTYERSYAKVVEERGKVASELGKVGRNTKEISDILDATLPFPEEPDFSEGDED
jgi:hypothetical protein